MRTGLHVHGQVRGAGLGEGLEVALGLLDHQVHVQGQLGGALVGLHQEWPHGEIRDEMTVHHVDMDPVGAGAFTGCDILAQAQMIGGHDGRGDEVGVHDYLMGGL